MTTHHTHVPICFVLQLVKVNQTLLRLFCVFFEVFIELAISYVVRCEIVNKCDTSVTVIPQQDRFILALVVYVFTSSDRRRQRAKFVILKLVSVYRISCRRFPIKLRLGIETVSI